MYTLTISNPDIANLLTHAAWIFLLVAILLGFLYFSEGYPRKHSILIIAIFLIVISASCIVANLI